MLNAAGVEFTSIKPQVDEDKVKVSGKTASAIASELAERKAASIDGHDWVIGSDSVVSVADQLFSKPRDRNEARNHLHYFSGRMMHLTSAVALAHRGSVDWSHSETAKLAVRELSDDFIETYLDAEWPDVSYTVGVFRMEGRGVQLFSSIDGDHFAILGMPLVPLLGALRDRGLMVR